MPHNTLAHTAVSASSSNCGLSEIGNYPVIGSAVSSIMRIYKVTNLSSGRSITLSHNGACVQFALIKIN